MSPTVVKLNQQNSCRELIKITEIDFICMCEINFRQVKTETINNLDKVFKTQNAILPLTLHQF